MRKLLVQGDTVINVIEFDPTGDWTAPAGTSLMDGAAHIGDVWNGEAFVTPVPPVAVPEELTRWQFFAAAALAGLISWTEAEAALTGDLPQLFLTFIATLPAQEQPVARMLLKGNQVFHRHHPFVEAFLAANGMTAAQADAVWLAGAALGVS